MGTNPNPAFHDIVSEIRRFAETTKDLTSLQPFRLCERAALIPWMPSDMSERSRKSTHLNFLPSFMRSEPWQGPRSPRSFGYKRGRISSRP
jgi:hypothetical protein